MRFIITGRNIDVTDGLRSAVEEKLGKHVPPAAIDKLPPSHAAEVF